ARRRTRGAVFEKRRFHIVALLCVVNYGPAIILPGFKDVHFIAARTFPLKAARAVLRLEREACAGLPRNSLRITIAVGPDLRTHVFASDERIIFRDAAVVVQTQNLAGER